MARAPKKPAPEADGGKAGEAPGGARPARKRTLAGAGIGTGTAKAKAVAARRRKASAAAKASAGKTDANKARAGKASAKKPAARTAEMKKTAAAKPDAKKAGAKKPAAKTPAGKRATGGSAGKKAPARKAPAKKSAGRRAKETRGYGPGDVSLVMSVDAVAREAERIAAERPGVADLDRLAGGEPLVAIDNLRAGYGRMEILHDFSLRIGKGQSLCLIGPNGAGKSTVLHSVFGFTNIFSGVISVAGRDVTRLSPSEKLSRAGVAYILQDNSVFPDMSVEENLWMGGFLFARPVEARLAAEAVFDRYPRLAARRHQPARVLSGGERRLLEISRALVMNPEVLLVDEPSIGLEPRFIDMVFEILDDLQHGEGKTIIMVEQNAKKGLEYADIGYVLVSGQLAKAGRGDELLADPEVGRLFLGG